MRYLALILIFCSSALAINYHGCTLAPDNLHGWVVCYDTVLILNTSDGGLTWSPQTAPDSTRRSFFDVTCVDEMHAWAVGLHYQHAAEIVGTTDGGNHWERQVAGFSKYATRIEFLNPNYGMAVGGYGALAITTNGGAGWNQVYTGWDLAELYGVSIVNQNDSWICAGYPDSLVTGQGYITWTNDGGLTWDTTNGFTSTGYEDFFDMHMFNVFDGIIVGGYEDTYEPIVWKTIDGAETWNPRSVPVNTYYLRAVDFVDQEGWAVGKSGTIIHTTDGGDTWTTQISPADSTLFDVDFSDAQHGLACGYDYILRTTNGGQDWLPTGIEESETNAPKSLALTINPNPFKQITDIRYEITDPGYQKLTLNIYDITGRSVREFFEEFSVVGHQLSVRWDGTDNEGKRLPAGVYLAELKTPDNRVSEKIVRLE